MELIVSCFWVRVRCLPLKANVLSKNLAFHKSHISIILAYHLLEQDDLILSDSSVSDFENIIISSR